MSDLEPEPIDETPTEPREKPAGVLRAAPVAKPPSRPTSAVRAVEELPSYSRSLLRIKVPVMVTLARKKQPTGNIVELGPGTIIQFSKSCEQTLDLEVNGLVVGEGEAVKVGEKFGLRIVALKLPDERFHSLAPKRTA